MAVKAELVAKTTICAVEGFPLESILQEMTKNRNKLNH